MLSEEIIGIYDEELLIEALKIFLVDGKESVNNIIKGLEDKDGDQIKFSAHKLKGSSGMIGAVEVSGVSKDIEDKARENDLEMKIEIEKLKSEFDKLIQYITSKYEL